MNGFFNPYAYSEPFIFPGRFKLFSKISDVTDPAGIWVIIDERESINNAHFLPCMEGIYPRDPLQFGICNFPANYHNGAGGLNFADGHSEVHKWRDSRTTPPKGGAAGGGLGNPIRSPKNLDSYWLGQRSTVLR